MKSTSSHKIVLSRRNFLGGAAALSLAAALPARATMPSPEATRELGATWALARRLYAEGAIGPLTHAAARLPYAADEALNAIGRAHWEASGGAIAALTQERFAPLAETLPLGAPLRVNALGGSSLGLSAPDMLMAALEYREMRVDLATAPAGYAGPMAVAQGERGALEIGTDEVRVISPLGETLRRVKAPARSASAPGWRTEQVDTQRVVEITLGLMTASYRRGCAVAA